MDVVLDKSYLRGASTEQVRRLCTSHRVIFSESLLYELLTTESNERAQCFSKIPDTENPLLLIPNVGPLLRWEIEHNQPCRHLDAVAIKGRYIFNKGLRNHDFDLGEEQEKALRDWQYSIAEGIQGFKERSAVVSVWFPELRGYTPGASTDPIDAAKTQISSDSSLVRELYADIRHPTWPEPDCLTEDWVLYRWVQVQVLAALDYVRRYGDGNAEMIAKAIENEYLDLGYCITAIIAGALASRDPGMIERFTRVKPDGMVIT